MQQCPTLLSLNVSVVSRPAHSAAEFAMINFDRFCMILPTRVYIVSSHFYPKTMHERVFTLNGGMRFLMILILTYPDHDNPVKTKVFSRFPRSSERISDDASRLCPANWLGCKVQAMVSLSVKKGGFIDKTCWLKQQRCSDL